MGLQFVYEFEADGATSLSATGLPPGMAFIPELGVIAGIPTAAGNFQVTLSASTAQRTTTATLVITVQNAPSFGPVIFNSTSVTGRTGRPFQFQVLTSGGNGAVTLSATSLPPGLRIDPVTGLISGVPRVDGNNNVTLTATDGTSTSTATLQLNFISDARVPVIVSPSAVSITPGVFFSYKITALANSADNDPTRFAALFLPSGLTFDAATGVISGVLTAPAHPEKRRGLSGGALGTVVGTFQVFGTNSTGTGTAPVVLRTKTSAPPTLANGGASSGLGNR